ncbi:purine nucleosidase [Nitrospirillum amazonense]|uniref:Purine nucleosidase n=1 Tax=Nitrospirillum amazonense TaxID=28077 RepID=A0A560FJH5_9PROT|nr:nucleoside hydrolase [Nitrospirillum amazonense]TWB21764.1 purine nucleosidase [Nitrospirillum amazonense]
MTAVLIDCDPGIDDALALALAVASPELDVRAVTCVAGNRPVAITAANARRLLDLFGRPDIPVHAGAARPLLYPQARTNLVHGEDGLGGVSLGGDARPVATPGLAAHAADALAHLLLSPLGTDLTVVAMGPLTNLALAEIRHPGLLARARSLHIMGGAAHCPGNVTPAAEFNFWADPAAAHVVLTAGAKLEVFPLDVTSQAAMTPAWLAALAAQPTRSAQALAAMLAVYGEQDPLLHDACPVAALLRPQLFSGRTGRLEVDWRPGPDEGCCRLHQDGEVNAALYTGLDTDGLLSLMAERLARLP